MRYVRNTVTLMLLIRKYLFNNFLNRQPNKIVNRIFYNVRGSSYFGRL